MSPNAREKPPALAGQGGKRAIFKRRHSHPVVEYLCSIYVKYQQHVQLQF
ncbi:hypothetical protein CCP3SC5AM1_1560005 [Gammaproteobacteria bacterium]